MPITTPLDDTVPTAALVLLHTPPPVPLDVSDVVLPAHTVAVPLMVPPVGTALTVTATVADELQPLAAVTVSEGVNVPLAE